MRKPIVSVSTLALGLLLGLGLGATSCTSKHKHCYFAEGDATCKAEFGEGYFCVAEGCDGYEQNIGCVTEMPSAECHAPNGMDDGMADGSSESASASSTEATTETTNPDSTATEATDAETTSSGCTQDSECEDASMPNTPFCVDGACVGCGEAQASTCAQVYPEVPVCNANTGACVECLAGGDVNACGGTTPVCDAETNTCVGCKWHEECPETACKMKTGECFPGTSDDVLQVGDATALTEAINTIADSASKMGVIRLTASFQTSATVPANTVVAILGDGQSVSIWTGPAAGNKPALSIDGGAEAYIQGVRIAATQDNEGIVVDGSLWLDRSAIVNNTGGGVQINGSATIRNSFVGGSINDVAAIDVQGGTATISFTTIGAGFGTSAGLRCMNGNTVTVTNSLLVSRSTDDVVQCDSADITLSAIEQQQVGDNVMLGAMDTAWFTNYANGDFHLSGMHPAQIETAASWQPGDPLVDIDGEDRTQATQQAAGADLP